MTSASLKDVGFFISSLIPVSNFCHLSANFLFPLNSCSPWLSQLHLCFSLLTAEVSFPIPICHGNLSRLLLFCFSWCFSHTGTSDMCIHLGLSIHPVLYFSHRIFLGKCLCQFNFHMAAAELPRSPLKC